MVQECSLNSVNLVLLFAAAIMKELAQEYGFSYDTLTADIDEQALGDRQRDPAALVALLAQAKAEAILAKLRASEQRPLKGYLLTCDQARGSR